MENGILVALSAQNVLRRNLDVIANNLANTDTPGFKAERFLVVDQPLASPRPVIDGPAATSFVRDLASVSDATDGRLEETGNPLDVALRGEGYFVLSTADGERYTRDGHFRLDSSGQLVNEDGYRVQGEGGAAIVIGAEDAVIGVNRDGTMTSEKGEIGKLRIVGFADPTALEPAGGGLVMTDQQPQPIAAPDVIQGMIEKSNVEPILEIERMIRVQRAYDQAKLVIDREDERIRKMVVVFVE